MQRAVLQAHWSNVAIVSYPVPPELLTKYVPRGCVLDTHKGQAWASLVAYDLDEVKIWNWAIPGYRSFPEVSLRFYVRQGKERGVCFVREFVPKWLVASVASRFYNEPYLAVKMSSDVHHHGDGIQVEHKLKTAGHTQKITVATSKEPPLLLPADSDEAWFKDQQWGFGRNKKGHTIRYRMAHPQWLTYRVSWHEVKMDWGRVYGPEWKVLKGAKPASVILAEGSPVTIFEAAAVA